MDRNRTSEFIMVHCTDAVSERFDSKVDEKLYNKYLKVSESKRFSI